MVKQAVKLKPCPFCSNGLVTVRNDLISDCSYVHCGCCEADGPVAHENMGSPSAIELWNARGKPSVWGQPSRNT